MACVRPRPKAWPVSTRATDRHRSVRDGTAFRAEHRLKPVMGSPPRVLTECLPIEDESIGGFAGSMTRLMGASQPTSLSDARRERGAALRD